MRNNIIIVLMLLGLTFLGTSVVLADLSCGLVAYYPFSGNANDESGNGYNGVVYGASMTTDRHGNTNGAYVFDGVDDYVLISNMGSQPSSITLSEWFKINSLTSTSQSIIAIQDSSTPISGYHYTPVGIYAGEITGSLWNIGNIIGQTLKTNTWYHAVLTYDSSKKVQKLYLNGQLQGGNSGTPSLPSSMYIYLGQREKDCSFTSTSGLCSIEATYFNGTMDDFRVYNRALSESEIQELYTGETTISTPTPSPTPTPTITATPTPMPSPITVTCEQENTLDNGDNCNWPYSQTDSRCCCWCPDPTGAHAYGHVMDLGKTISNVNVYFEIKPGAGDAGCVTTGYMYYSTDGSSWTLFWSKQNVKGWTTYSDTVYIQDNFRYIRANTDGCSVDWSKIEISDGTTSGSAPTVTTGYATNITSSTATLNGIVNANGSSTKAWFEYSTTSGSYNKNTASETINGANDTTVSINVSGLSFETSYYYRIAAQNSKGTSYGSEASFTTSTTAVTPTPTPTATQPTIPTPTPVPSPSPSNEGVVLGFVYDEDEDPMRDVTVTIVGANGRSPLQNSTETDAEGYYEFTGLAAGDYALTYEKEGYITENRDVSMEGDETVVYVDDIFMEEIQKGSIYGYVVDIRGAALEKVKLKLKGVKTKVTKTASSDRDGFFEFEDLDPDTYRVAVTKKFYKKVNKVVKLEEGEDKEIEIEMKKTSKRVLDKRQTTEEKTSNRAVELIEDGQ